MKPSIETERLVIRPWRDIDVSDALVTYGDEEVTPWLTPIMNRVPNVLTMRAVLHEWQAHPFTGHQICGPTGIGALWGASISSDAPRSGHRTRRRL